MKVGERQVANFAMRYGWPNCAQCKHPVDSFSVAEKFETRSLVVTAHCHGEKETVEIPHVILTDGDFRIDGEAFKQPPQLAAQEPASVK